jgi:hypothetical protein
MKKDIRRNNHIAPLGIFYFRRVKFSLCVSLVHRENAKGSAISNKMERRDDELRQYVLGTYYSTGVGPPLKSITERRGNKH